MPTLFQREFDHHRVVNITDQLTSPELAWVLAGEGIATEKIDGACCALIGGQFYKRYDAKQNKQGVLKQPPVGAIPCDVPDPVTGHWPHWVPVDEANAADQWFLAAKANTPAELTDGTYEAIGPHFNGNPHQLKQDVLVRHGEKIFQLENRSFEGIRTYLEQHCIEGIVFWKDGMPGCKIKRRDFGFDWPYKKQSHTQLDGVGKAIRKKQTAPKHLETFQRLKPISDKSKRGMGFIRKQYAEKHQQELNEFAKAVRYMNANGIKAADHERIANELQQLLDEQSQLRAALAEQNVDPDLIDPSDIVSIQLSRLARSRDRGSRSGHSCNLPKRNKPNRKVKK